MQQFTRPGEFVPFSLAQWVGWRIRSVAMAVGSEVAFLEHRVRHATSSERLAWWYRCATACVLVVAEFLALWALAPRLDSVFAMAGTWAVIAVLPRPTPRIPLLAARLLAFGATLGAANALWLRATATFPSLQSWDGVFTIAWGLLCAGLFIWALLAVRRPVVAQPAVAVPQASGGGRAVSERMERWSNVPAISFREVGGAEAAKQEIRALVGNRLAKSHPNRTRNGILLYGPQGTGKTMLAEATAGEFRVNFLHVRCPDLVGQYVGATGAEIRKAFETAAANRPVVLFLDEIDAIGTRRQMPGAGSDAGGAGREYNTVTTQLMSAIDKHRSLDGLIIMAATNQLDGLEPTLIREGRFDVKVRLDLPDKAERARILGALLARERSRPFDLAGVARRTPGWSPARLNELIDRAAEIAAAVPIEERHVIGALERTGGRDRPQLDRVEWDDVVLPESVVNDLKSILELMQPGRAEKLHIPVPTGLILTGAPGTGKTLTARLIASQSERSFYPITPSDILSGEVGGSTKRLRDAFARAKENAPSILFFDEMDGLFPSVYGPVGQHDVQLVEQALMEISALKPEHNLLLIGTTNYLNRVDPRIVRGGRFSERIEIGTPDASGYRTLLFRYLGTARLAESVRVEDLINRLQGMTPADLEATVTGAKRSAMRRMPPNGDLPALVADDFESALA